ncbi:unnamed protein product [Arctogadus glacialis]
MPDSLTREGNTDLAMSNDNSSSNSATDELDDTAQAWNTHTIRPSKNPNVPSGRPNVMFALLWGQETVPFPN